MALTINVIAESTVAEQIDVAWKVHARMLTLDDDPTFRRIVEESSVNPMLQRLRKALTRGYPRYAFAA